MATITGTDASDFLVGTDDGDLVNGGLGNDTIRGLGGNDTLNGAEGNDDLDGGDGNDYLIGGAGEDTLQGGLNADTLEGGTGNDVLRGGKGHDSIDGGGGDDTIYSGLGQDTLTGGSGADVFVVRGDDPNFPGALKSPTITDFVAGTDTVAIQGATDAEITTALSGQTTVDGGVSFEINGATVVVKGTGLTSLTASNVVTEADIPTSNPGQSYALTTAIDNLEGTSGDDTFTGDNATASAADQIDGGSGTDTLQLYGTLTAPDYSNIETLELNGPGVTTTYDVSSKAGLTTLNLVDPTTLSTFTIGNGQKVGISTVAAGETIDLAGNAVTSLDLTLNSVAASGADATIDLNSTAQTTLNLVTSTAKSQVTLTNTGAKLSTINISGDQALELGHALTTVTTIDASASTGAVNIDAVGASNLTFTGGSGADKIAMAATITGSDKLDGGAGTDTLSVTDADTIDSTTEVANIKNFEIFEAAATDGTTYNLSFLNANNSLTGLVVSGAGATTTVSNINAASTGNISITADATAVLTASDFVSGGTSDTATITLGTGSVSDVDATLTFANMDVLNLVSKSDGTPTKTVGGGEENSIALTATDLEKIVVTGDEAVAISTTLGTNPTEIDASGMTGAAVSVDTDASAIASILVKGSAGSDSIDIDNAATTTSTLYLGGGSDTVVVDGGGASAHTLKFTTEALNSGDVKAGNASTVTLTGAAAGDTVTLDFLAAFEGLLKSGGTALSAASANVNIHGTTLSSTTNIAANQAAGNMVIQIDLNGDGSYVAADDYQLTLVGTLADDTLVYNAATDVFTFTVV